MNLRELDRSLPFTDGQMTLISDCSVIACFQISSQIVTMSTFFSQGGGVVTTKVVCVGETSVSVLVRSLQNQVQP